MRIKTMLLGAAYAFLSSKMLLAQTPAPPIPSTPPAMQHVPESPKSAVSTPAPSPVFSTPKPAVAGDPSAEQLALGRQIIVDSGISRAFGVTVAQYLDQIGANLTQTRPDLIKDLNIVLEQVKPEFDKSADALIDECAKYYAQSMSEEELRVIVAFFTSPAGKKYVQTQPQAMNAIFGAMQNWAQRISIDMMQRVREEMVKKGHDL